MSNKNNLYFVEAVANVFARELLMPTKEVESILDNLFKDQYKGKYDTSIPFEMVLNIIIEKFGVPIEQAKIRLLEFGIPA